MRKVGKEDCDTRYTSPRLERNSAEGAYTDGEFGPDLCVDFICKFIDQNKEQPFLVYYPMMLTHCPFVPVPGGEDWDPTSSGSPSHKGDPKYFAGIDWKQSPIPFDGQSFVPQLNGEPGQPRVHIFCWYSRSGNVDKELQVFARTRCYKLYRDGRFHNVSQDRLEQKPLPGNQLTPEQKAVRQQLQEVLAQRQKLTGR